MSDQTWERIEAIIDEALALPKEQRREFVDYKCAGNEELKSEVTLLLNSIADSEGWLEEPDQYKEDFYKEMVNDPNAVPGSSLIGQQIGPYLIKELLGEGGMGLVYLAERTDGAFEHKVALKVIREGMDTEQNIRRFQQEQRILAGLNHPNIAGILDGGVADNGLPYLIMEYVDGIPIDTYCNEHRLSIEERLELIKTICSVVQYAHNNLVIHRDLKPENILVDTEGHVRILDFGISKLLDPDQADASEFRTHTGARILTFGYAAPEQIQGQTITTAVDNYALCVLMYKLLTGVLPFDQEDKTSAEIQNLIVKTSAPKPSERFKNLTSDQKAKIGRQRHSTPEKMIRDLQGDLDAIILKNLRKEPETRYNSPAQLKEDLERHEEGLPVSAREGKVRYHISKFIRRHRKGIALTTIFILTIIGFGLFYTHQITQERNRAKLEAEKAKQVTEFITDLFGKSNPYLEEEDGGLDLKIGSVLEYGTSQIDQQLNDQPEVRAELKTVIGEVYSQLGEFRIAETLLSEALDLRDSLYEEPRKETAESIKSLAFLYQEQGKYDEAESLLKKAINIFERSEEGIQNEIAISAMGRLGNLLWFNKGDYKTSEKILHRTLELHRKIHPDSHVHIAINLNDLATLYHAQGSYSKAMPYYAESIEMYQQLNEEHSNLAIIMSNFSALLRESGEYEKAEQVQRNALKMHRKLTGEQSIDVALGLGNLAQALLEQKKYAEADSLINLSIQRLQNIYGEQHPYISRTKLNQGRLYLRQNQFEKAERLLLQTEKEFQIVYPENHPRTSDPLLELGLLYLKTEKPQKAATYLEKAHAIRMEGYPPDSWRVAQTMSAYGFSLSMLNKFSKADSMVVNSYQLLKEVRGVDDDYTKQAYTRLAAHYKKWNKIKELEKYSDSISL